ncbi:porin [Burkholderia sp. Bp9017]|uniref:porin n=1 Tax=unclassified Burkholderia TaxID=2613784 RepID=UPI000F5F6D64|nr:MULTISPECIES: porin [unclassified Burkholderia]RQZ15015.1 porin [Burkholderia sp. Bp9017]RQZ26607.1 porin [Burkholderia sp. Bp9016]
MKRTIITTALLCGPSLAFPQSSVTLYGLLEDGVTYVNNSGDKGSVTSLVSSIAQGNKWGLLGTEDLGSGWKTIFKLENGFNPNNGKLGNGGLEFGRSAFIGVANDRLGTFTLGRQYDAIPDFYAPTTMNGNWGAYFSHANDIDNSDSTYRISSTVKYVSPNMNGLQVEGLVALGGVPGSVSAKSTVSAGVRFSNGPIYVAAAYTSSKTPASQFPDGNWVANQQRPTANGAFGYVGQPANMQVAGIGGTYQFGKAKVGLSYDNVRFADANGTNRPVLFNNYEIWSQYYWTPFLAFAAGYTFTSVTSDSGNSHHPRYNQFNLIADYFISKRTDIQILTVFQKTSGGALADIYNGFPATQSSTDRQLLARVAIRHKF